MATFFKITGQGLILLVVLVGGAQTRYCDEALDTDVVIAIHDSAATMYRWWGGIIIAPGITNFLRPFVTAFDLSKVRISIIAYGSTVRELAPFTSDASTLQSALKWYPEFGRARTYDAVDYITDYFRDNARANTAKLAIFLTNRPSNNVMATLSRSIRLRGEEVSVMGVAFGRLSLYELRRMAVSYNNVVYTYDHRSLYRTIPTVKRRVCYLVESHKRVLMRSVLSDTVLVLDRSDSTRRFTGLDYTWAPPITNFATQFFDLSTVAKGQCATGVVTFSDDGTVQQSITTDLADQNNAIANLGAKNTIPFAGSRIAPAIIAATDALLKNGNKRAQKFMIVIMDGSPVDPVECQAAAEDARAAGIKVFAVSLRTLAGLAVNAETLTMITDDVQRTMADRTDTDLPQVADTVVESTCRSIMIA